MPKSPIIITDDPSINRLNLREIKNATVSEAGVRPVKTTSTKTKDGTVESRAALSPSAARMQKIAESTVTSDTVERVVSTPDGTLVVVNTDKDVYVTTYESVTEQNYITNEAGGTSGVSGLNIGVFSGSSYADIVPGATVVGFDVNAGFIVTQASTGVASISLSPSYSGISGYSGASGLSGYSGQVGQQGFSGYSGIGTSGYSGAQGNNNLIWSAAGNQRTLTQYVNPDDSISNVRTAEFIGDKLTLTLATFTPILSATVSPGITLQWDVPATGFTVNVDNPSDYTTEWITAATNLNVTSGSISSIGTFTTAGPAPTPAGGIDWNQTFTTNLSSYIRPISSTIVGGSATADVQFNYWNGVADVPYTDSTALLSVNWVTPTMTLTLGALSGQQFLSTYTNTSYTVTVGGVSNPSNYANAVTASGGVVSNPNGSGSFTFSTPINKNNVADVRTVSNNTTFNRPASVTGTAYSANIISNQGIPSITFIYPTLWTWTTYTGNVPGRANFVSGNNFAPGVTVLGDQVMVFSAYINNSDVVPKAFWFAVRTAAAQPTIFKTGPSPSLLSDVAVTTGNTVNLEPDVPPVGYTSESYTLYGITLQPGLTYVSIS